MSRQNYDSKKFYIGGSFCVILFSTFCFKMIFFTKLHKFSYEHSFIGGTFELEIIVF